MIIDPLICTATAAHVCDICRLDPIRKGEVHRAYEREEDGNLYDVHEHVACSVLAKLLFGDKADKQVYPRALRTHLSTLDTDQIAILIHDRGHDFVAHVLRLWLHAKTVQLQCQVRDTTDLNRDLTAAVEQWRTDCVHARVALYKVLEGLEHDKCPTHVMRRTVDAIATAKGMMAPMRSMHALDSAPTMERLDRHGPSSTISVNFETLTVQGDSANCWVKWAEKEIGDA
jgi:hypothetical protein